MTSSLELSMTNDEDKARLHDSEQQRCTEYIQACIAGLAVPKVVAPVEITTQV